MVHLPSRFQANRRYEFWNYSWTPYTMMNFQETIQSILFIWQHGPKPLSTCIWSLHFLPVFMATFMVSVLGYDFGPKLLVQKSVWRGSLFWSHSKLFECEQSWFILLRVWTKNEKWIQLKVDQKTILSRDNLQIICWTNNNAPSYYIHWPTTLKLADLQQA